MNSDARQPVLILGAGLGGLAVLEMLVTEPTARLVGIADSDPNAIGLKIARKLDVPVFTDAEAAMKECAPCMVFNMTNNEALSDVAAKLVGTNGVVGGNEARLFWEIITKLQVTQKSLAESQARLHAVIQNVREGILSINPQGIIESVNPALEAMFGYEPGELAGNNISILVPEPHRSMHDIYLREYLRTGASHVIGQYREVEAVRKGGEVFSAELNVAEMELDGRKHFVGLVRDITDRKLAEEKLTQLAMYDQLTGLPNRTMFYDKLKFLLAQTQRTGSKVALLFIDLDGFKAINDEMGHDMGDHVLNAVSRCIKVAIRESDLAARLGGDEFTVVLSNLQDVKHVARVAAMIIAAINEPIELNGRSCRVGASIGIAVYPDDAEAIGDLIKLADQAMYQAKADGKNVYYLAGAIDRDPLPGQENASEPVV